MQVSAFTTYDVAGLELAWGFLANAAIWTLYSRLGPMDLFLLVSSLIFSDMYVQLIIITLEYSTAAIF
jgi:hypothetical protein